jgi:hypothetical protein
MTSMSIDASTIDASTIDSSTIDANMILENDRFEEESTRVNWERFAAVQEAETLRCQKLRESAEDGPSPTYGASAKVRMRQSARILVYDSCPVVFDIRSGSAFGSYHQNTPSITGQRTEQMHKKIPGQLKLTYEHL